MIIYNAEIQGKLSSVTVSDGVIASVGENVSSGDIDAGGLRLIPGLIDVHTHGCIGMDTMDADFEPMCRFYAEHGTTSFLPTTMTMGYDALERVTEAKTNFVNALYDYNTSKIALETSMGVPVAVTAAANTTNLPTMSTETAAE